MIAAEFFAAMACGLGLDPRSDRIAIASSLADSTRDGRPRALRVDEAQNASADLLEEIRILDNRLGRDDGFAAIVLVAQTPLVRRLNLRILGGLEVRLAAHAHLMPIDADEAETLMADAGIDGDTAESLHRSAMGNPARLLRLALAERPAMGAESRENSRPRPSLESSPGTILPSRPPLSVADGVIEVGWDSDVDTAANAEENADPELESEPLDDEPDVPEDRPNLRAEGVQDFAPYSQLFARMKQVGDLKDRSGE